MRLSLPGPSGRMALAAFGLTWLAVLCGRFGWWIPVVMVGLALGLPRRWRSSLAFILMTLLAGATAGFLGMAREIAVLTARVPDGHHVLLVVAATDSRSSRFGGVWFLARPIGLAMNRAAPEEANWVEWRGPPIVVSLGTGDVGPIEVGERLAVSGRFTRSPGFAGGSPFAGRLVAIRAVPVSDTGSPFLRVGNSLRRRAVEQLRDRGPDAALLSGFVVGDINQLPQADVEALRLAGLSHFVAVSGSNVAGFLLLWFILLGPLGVGSRRRGVLGVVAIVVYAIATRWEPSVVRASLMAGVILGGRAVGVPVDTWMALGWSGTLAMLVAPGLAVSVGFQLSVLATVGIMVGSDLLSPNLPRWLRRSLGPTLAAQAAVTPLLLAMFGSVPLISPLANLVAAPLVSIATLLGTLGVALGLEPIVNSSLAVASLILNLAHFAAGFPQISVVGLLLVIGAALLARSARIRPVLAVGAAIVLVWTSLVARPVNPPAVIFLDVGQGDSSLIVAVEGRAILVDAGPDPTGLLNALRHYRINQIDLLVLTHPHEDHVGGLEGVVGRVRIARVWVWGNNHKTESWNRVHQALLARRVPIEVPPVGTVEGYGGVELEVLGPVRRYESLNEQSLVIMVRAAAGDVLLTGDIETLAQNDLGPIGADILKVPHHGGATSSLAWLQAADPELAVISVGENDYGHPSPKVVEALVEIGASVVRTDQAGDVVVPLGEEAVSLAPVAAIDRSP